jgi:hypothetical protein
MMPRRASSTAIGFPFILRRAPHRRRQLGQHQRPQRRLVYVALGAEQHPLAPRVRSRGLAVLERGGPPAHERVGELGHGEHHRLVGNTKLTAGGNPADR